METENKTLLAFDNDGVLRDESVSYLRCIRETVAFFLERGEATEDEMMTSMKESNDDWERTFNILSERGKNVEFEVIKNHFQDLYLGKKRDFTGYINNEPWLVNNALLERLYQLHDLVIISGAPKEELVYTLKKNNALSYFSLILGMEDCENKLEGLLKTREIFNPDRIYFCDDRPSPIKKVKPMKKYFDLNIYGILPPKVNKDWDIVLTDAGAEKVFANVNEYCEFVLKNENNKC